MDWRPMSEIPPEMRDGREVLLFFPNAQRAVVAAWSAGRVQGWECTYGYGFHDKTFSHFAAIELPVLSESA